MSSHVRLANKALLAFSFKELMDATNEMATNYAQNPLVTMSMRGLRAICMLDGEVFGSSMTFGSAGTKSAPGQIPVSELRLYLKTIHDAQNLG